MKLSNTPNNLNCLTDEEFNKVSKIVANPKGIQSKQNQIENLQAFQSLWVHQEVTNLEGDRHGIITELNSYGDEDFLEVMVKWKNGSETPEAPVNLKSVVKPVEGLTYDQAKQLSKLEQQIQASFWQAGKAFKEIYDQKLYKHRGTFEDYCRTRFSFTYRHCFRLMQATEVVDNIVEANLTESVTLPLPTAETQVRPITGFNPRTRVEIWLTAVETNLGRVPTEKVVKEVVKKFKPQVKIDGVWEKGDVAIVVPKDNEELNGLSGMWCIITAVNEFSCEIATIFGTHQAFSENLKDLDCSERDKQSYQQLLKRLSNISYHGLAETEQIVIKAIAKINRTISKENNSLLTSFEEMVLQLIETKVETLGLLNE